MTDSTTGFLGSETNSGKFSNSNGVFSQENNTVALVTESIQIPGQYGNLTIEPDGSFRYNYTVGSDNRNVREDFTYTVVDSKGFSDTAHLYIRLSDNAPDFPTGTEVQSRIAEDDILPDSAGGDDMYAQNVPDSMPEDIELASVPLPYDPADSASVIA